MVYNYCQRIYLEGQTLSSEFEFKVANYTVNFKDMTEEQDSEVREIRKVED